MGGFSALPVSGDARMRAVEAYNPRTNAWRSCLPLRQRREGAVAGVVGGRLVVAGGYGGDDRHISRSLHSGPGGSRPGLCRTLAAAEPRRAC